MKKSDYEKLPKTEEKIFGYDAEQIKELTEAYCKQEHDHLSADNPLSDKPLWDSVHEGCDKLAKEHPEIIKLI